MFLTNGKKWFGKKRWMNLKKHAERLKSDMRKYVLPMTICVMLCEGQFSATVLTVQWLPGLEFK